MLELKKEFHVLIHSNPFRYPSKHFFFILRNVIKVSLNLWRNHSMQYPSFPRSHLRATHANYIKRKTFIYYAACAVNSPEGNKGTRSRRGA